MGFNLTIGELRIDYDNDEDCPSVNLGAKLEEHSDAPAFGEPTDYSNQRWPSYTSWHNFCKFVGLMSLFYGNETGDRGTLERDDSLLYEHPGCVPLTERHRKEINAALEYFKNKYPDAIPTYGNAKDFTPDPDNPEENGQLCRLVWLHYWVNWALDNCEQPVFANS